MPCNDVRHPVEDFPQAVQHATCRARAAAIDAGAWPDGETLAPYDGGTGGGTSGPLDAVPDLQDWTYKVSGLLVWMILLFTFGAMLDAPKMALSGVRLLGLYVIFRVLVTALFYPVGLLRCYWQHRRSAHDNGTLSPVAEHHVHHVVVVPNYREPLEILTRTLEALAVQHEASHRLTVVLAMEGAEAEAETKACRLCERFEGRFAHLLVTYHPPNLPGEIPGKACNQRWAARHARQYLVDRCGMALDDLTLTSCDADSLIHPSYFGAITQDFAGDSGRYYRFWQSPLRFDNNLWRIPSPNRVLAQFASIVNLSELANPFVLKLTQSTYTLSYRLAVSIDYWDSRVVAEDSHILLRAFFATGGRASLRPVFLPTTGDAVTGDSFGQALANFYQQRKRHAWGCQSTGYVLQQWNRHREIAFSQKLLYLLQVLQDYGLFATATFVLAAGWILDMLTTGSPMVSFAKLAIPAFFFEAMNGAGMVATAMIWATEHARTMRGRPGWRLTTTVFDLLILLLLPIFTLVLAVIPVIHANTQLLLGDQLAFVRTHKEGAMAFRQRNQRTPPADQ